MSYYRQLQKSLKALRKQGFDVKVKLNSKLIVLETEFHRLTDYNHQPCYIMAEVLRDTAKKDKFYWTGKLWDRNSKLAMIFSNVEAATQYHKERNLSGRVICSNL